MGDPCGVLFISTQSLKALKSSALLLTSPIIVKVFQILSVFVFIFFVSFLIYSNLNTLFVFDLIKVISWQTICLES